MEQDAVKCPVLKWSAQANCLEPQHEVPLSLSPGRFQALGLLAGQESVCVAQGALNRSAGRRSISSMIPTDAQDMLVTPAFFSSKIGVTLYKT